jgi:hypothetical protein
VRLRKNSAAVAIAPPVIAPEIMWSVRGLGSVSDRAAPVNAPPNNAFFCKSQILYQFLEISTSIYRIVNPLHMLQAF